MVYQICLPKGNQNAGIFFNLKLVLLANDFNYAFFQGAAWFLTRQQKTVTIRKMAIEQELLSSHVVEMRNDSAHLNNNILCIDTSPINEEEFCELRQDVFRVSILEYVLYGII